ncbi:MAG: hypothetical protein GX325_04850 [Peptococcaceae bacterium]|nr:hypothetical protein [Peptococcaceae bacterium]
MDEKGGDNVLTTAVNDLTTWRQKYAKSFLTRDDPQEFDQVMMAILAGGVPTKGPQQNNFSLMMVAPQGGLLPEGLTDGLVEVTGKNAFSEKDMVPEKAGAVFIEDGPAGEESKQSRAISEQQAVLVQPEEIEQPVAGKQEAAHGDKFDNVRKMVAASLVRPEKAMLLARAGPDQIIQGCTVPEPAADATVVNLDPVGREIAQCVPEQQPALDPLDATEQQTVGKKEIIPTRSFDNVLKMNPIPLVQPEEAVVPSKVGVPGQFIENAPAGEESKQSRAIWGQPPAGQQLETTGQPGVRVDGKITASIVQPEGAMEQVRFGGYQEVVEEHSLPGQAPKATVVAGSPDEAGESKNIAAHLQQVFEAVDTAGKQDMQQPEKPADRVIVGQSGSLFEGAASSGGTGSTTAFEAAPSSGSAPQSEPFQPGVNWPDLKAQLAQGLRQILNTHQGNRQTEVQLKLQPEHLGRLTIRMFIEQGELSVYFYTGNQQVKEVLEGSLQQLRDSLNQHNLRLDQAFVLTEDGGGDSTGHYCPGEKGGSQWTHGGSQNNAFPGEQLEQVPITAIEKGPGRINYLI